jgi:hypothetical protein
MKILYLKSIWIKSMISIDYERTEFSWIGYKFDIQECFTIYLILENKFAYIGK